jgi:hypothetical protein
MQEIILVTHKIGDCLIHQQWVHVVELRAANIWCFILQYITNWYPLNSLPNSPLFFPQTSKIAYEEIKSFMN